MKSFGTLYNVNVAFNYSIIIAIDFDSYSG